MPRPPKVCRVCGRPPREGEALSHRGYHIGCGLRRAEEAAAQMAARSGPAWESWLRSNALGAREARAEGGSPLPSSSSGSLVP